MPMSSATSTVDIRRCRNACLRTLREIIARHRNRPQRQRKGRIAAAQAALQLKCPHRVILGTDGPAGSGVQPLGMLRLISLLCSLGNIPAELAFCLPPATRHASANSTAV
jgi:hypothetical protein